MENRKFLKKEDIFSFVDREFVEIYVKEWQGYVKIGQMSAKERLSFEQRHSGKDSSDEGYMSDLVIDLLAMSLYDGEGKRLFETEQDIEQLGEKNSEVIKRLFQESARINGIDGKTVEEDKKK